MIIKGTILGHLIVITWIAWKQSDEDESIINHSDFENFGPLLVVHNQIYIDHYISFLGLPKQNTIVLVA